MRLTARERLSSDPRFELTAEIGSGVLNSVGFLLLTLIFAVSYTQAPLYFSSPTHNQYFLHGLLRAGAGFLKNDWLAHTTDPTPVFSFLVSLTSNYLDERFFYLYYTLLSGIYIYSLVGIGTLLFSFQNSKPRQLILFTVITGMHAPLFAEISRRFVGYDLGQLYTPVANHNLLGPYLQPSTFGVLLILSIYLFLLQRSLLATLSATFAASIHPSYLLCAATLAFSYMAVAIKGQEGAQRAIRIALWTLLTALPILLYSYIAFEPTSIELMRKSHDILVNFRIPHHARPADWMNAFVYVKLAIVGIAIYLVRKTALAAILLTSLLVAATLTIVQMVTGSSSLALVFPWRLSLFLAPISVSIIVAFCISYAYKRVPEISRYERLLMLLALGILCFVVLSGALRMRSSFANVASGPMLEFVKRTTSPADIFIIPTDIDGFRLYARAAIVVDFESIPYKDVEVIEWYERVQSINLLYESQSNRHCEVLRSLSERYKVSHIVVRTHPKRQFCKSMDMLHEDNEYSVYLLKFNK